MSEAVRYRVAMSQPHSHLFEVEASFPPQPEDLILAMPVWTPGSYLVREFSRQIQEVSATDEEGLPFQVFRVDKRTYRVAAPGRRLILRYRVYANELTVRTSHLDGTHGCLNGASVFLYVERLRGIEHRVTVDAPPGWRSFSALERQGNDFVASSYDELIDSPVEVGPHAPVEFHAAGVPHEIVIWGGNGIDRHKWAADLQKVCEMESQLFGGLPVRRYLFLVYLTDKGRGGLEHKTSTCLLFPRASLSNHKGWEDFLTLVAHEYFHLWNVKRIKPKSLVPFDYSQEVYTALLWAFEGITSYYDNLIVRRAGLMSAPRYLNRLGEALTALHSTPGRKVQTLADASMTAWIKHYRPDENSINSSISYYLKGEIVSTLLDLEIRRATQDRRTLDDVMRLLWKRFGDESGVPEDGVEQAASEIASADLSRFFDRSIRSTEELDYSPFDHVGLEVKFRAKESAADKGGSPPRVKSSDAKPNGWLGIAIKSGATIGSVLEGSPAMGAGLYAEDEIVALDGYRADGAGLISRCEEKRPGEVARIAVFRRDRLVEVEIRLDEKPADAAYIARREHGTEAQKTAFSSWLGSPWDEPGA